MIERGLKHLGFVIALGVLSLGWIKFCTFLLKNKEWFSIEILIGAHFILFASIAAGIFSTTNTRMKGDT